MEDKSLSASSFYKRASKLTEKQLFFVLDLRSPQQIASSKAPVKASAARDKDYFPSGYSRLSGNECKECGTSITTQWREGPTGRRTLCNGCGLRWKKAQKKKAKKDTADNSLSIKTGPQMEKAADLGTSPHTLLRPLKSVPSTRDFEATAAEKHQQHKNDGQYGNIANEQAKSKSSLSFILN